MKFYFGLFFSFPFIKIENKLRELDIKSIRLKVNRSRLHRVKSQSKQIDWKLIESNVRFFLIKLIKMLGLYVHVIASNVSGRQCTCSVDDAVAVRIDVSDDSCTCTNLFFSTKIKHQKEVCLSKRLPNSIDRSGREHF
jgi:hypothetical protein